MCDERLRLLVASSRERKTKGRKKINEIAFFSENPPRWAVRPAAAAASLCLSVPNGWTPMVICIKVTIENSEFSDQSDWNPKTILDV